MEQTGQRLTNTLCPKIGAAQWTCRYTECTCHKKELMPIRTVYEDGYSWVEIPDEQWANAEFTDFIHGMEVPKRN